MSKQNKYGKSSGSKTKKELEFDVAYAEVDEIPTAMIVNESDWKANSPKTMSLSKNGKHEDPSYSRANLNAAKPWPPALKDAVVRTFNRPINEEAGANFLSQFGWPLGLKETVFKSCKKIPIRFFIVDDSGSMILNDGKRLVTYGNQSKLVKCTRWSELCASLTFLAELSEALHAPSEFRLLNGADPIVVGLGDDNGESLTFFKEVLNESPAGPTPLCIHINAVVNSIQAVENDLRKTNQKAVVMIATDGESSDGDVADALRPLTNLPVLVILRLCTGEQKVVEYWNNIDNQLELDIDVLDDLLGDATQVNQINGWLTYGQPLHHLREFGASMKELDIIDESTLSSEQMRIICAYLFLGGNAKDLPHPGVDWHAFVSKVRALNSAEPKVFCSLTNAMRPWVDVNQLNRIYGSESNRSQSCAIM